MHWGGISYTEEPQKQWTSARTSEGLTSKQVIRKIVEVNYFDGLLSRTQSISRQSKNY